MRFCPRPEFLAPTDSTLHAAIRARVGVVGRLGMRAETSGGVVLAPSPRASGLHSDLHPRLHASLAVAYRAVADAHRRAIRFPVGLIVRGFWRVPVAAFAVGSLAVVKAVVGRTRKRLQVLRIHTATVMTAVVQRVVRRDRPHEYLVRDVVHQSQTAPVAGLNVPTTLRALAIGEHPAVVRRVKTQVRNLFAQRRPFHLLNIQSMGLSVQMSLQPH